MSKSKVRIIKSPTDAIKEIEKLAKSLKGPNKVKVGLPKGSNDYPDGTSVIMVGAVHEFGSPSRGVPERSYLRTTIVENRKKYKAMFKKLGKQIVDGKITTKKALGLLGQKVQDDVKQKIETIDSPPLVSRDGNPLIDTGHLRRSIIFEVGEE